LKLTKVDCLLQDVVSLRCGDKNSMTIQETLSADLLCHDVISLECGKTTT